MDDTARESKRQRGLSQLNDGEVFLYEGGKIAEGRKSEITRVRIGPQVKCIPVGTFRGCSNLAEVHFNEGLEVIRDSAFEGCSNLAAVQFDEGAQLQVIGKGAFRNCQVLQSVTFPSTITKLGNSAFNGCSNLADVHFNEGLEVIGDSAFHNCTMLRSVAIPSSVTTLGWRAFMNCTNLTRVRIGLQVKCIPVGTFRGCSNLALVQFDEGALLQTIEGDGAFFGGGAFLNCTALQSVTFPPTITKLGHGAFKGCSNLTEIQLNDGLRAIEERAFHSCEALQKVTIPSSVIKLGSNAFAACSNLAQVQLKEGLKLIEMGAFSHCKALQKVNLPSSAINLGGFTFLGCINLAEVHFNAGLKVIGESAFRGCNALQQVTIPPSVAILEKCAFRACTNLTEVILLGGGRFFSQGFLDHGLSNEGGALNQNILNKMVCSSNVSAFAFAGCPLTNIKISTPPSLSKRMARRMAQLPEVCRLSIERRIRDLHRLELTQDGNVLACFPVVRRGYNVGVQDTNNQTAESLDKVLQLIFYHELKECRTLIELAMWKSRLDEDRTRSDCRISIPDPAKSLIMEYCGFTSLTASHRNTRGLQ